MPAPAKQPAEAAAVVIHRGVTVRIYGPLPDRQKPVWLLAYYAGSQRKKQTVKGTLEDAKKQAKQVAAGITAGDLIDALHLTPLDRRVYLTAKEAAAKTGRAVDVLCREASEALAGLPAGVTLREAVAFYSGHHRSGLPAATVPAVIAELLEFLRHNKQRSPVTIATLKSILDPKNPAAGQPAFARDFPMPIAEVGTAQIERWLGQFHHAPRTLRNYRSAILRLFNFARGRYLPKNEPTAAETIEEVSEERGPVAIFRPWEIASILTHAPVELLPAIALGAFAGVRTCELCRIEFSALRLEEKSDAYPHGFIEIAKAAAKQHRTAARRLIPVAANLAAWLAPYRMREGPLSPYHTQSSLVRAISAVIKTVNEREAKARRREISRPANGLRHSFGSYRLPIIKSAAALAIEMNNSEAEVWRDYHELAAPRDVEAWWKIAPVDMPLFDKVTNFG